MDLKSIGLDIVEGGAKLVTLAKVVGHRTYVGKDNQPRFVTTILWSGGNRDLSTASNHPLYSVPENQKVLIAQTFLENRFGWKEQGEPLLVPIPK